MKKSILLIPAVPALALGGALSLEGCTPVRRGSGGGSGGDDDDATDNTDDGIVGDWELRRYGGYTYPIESTYSGCTTTTAYVMSVEADGDVEFAGGTSYSDGCEYDYNYPPTIYDGSWEELGTGVWRIDLSESIGVLTCTRDSTELECEGGDGDVIEFEQE